MLAVLHSLSLLVCDLLDNDLVRTGTTKDVKRGNWIQTDPNKGWFTILRLYIPLPSFFDKSRRAGEVELVN